MGTAYEESIMAVIQEEFGNAKYIVRESGDAGFEYKRGCKLCKYQVVRMGCSHDGTDRDIRKINGGANHGGECYEFDSLEQFWDTFSNTHAIDPETGEIFVIY